MKIVIFIFLSFNFCIFNLNVFAQDPIDIPHYKIYPKTPIVDYQAEILDFYSVKDLYGEFSNFALFPILVDGLSWSSSEHYYQAQKFLDPELKEKVRAAPTPYQAAQIGRDPNLPMREDWDDVKDGYMLIALHAKYGQYKVLQDLLKSTNNAHIYEHTKNDCYWADCLDRTGLNKLGTFLMQIRDELAQPSSSISN